MSVSYIQSEQIAKKAFDLKFQSLAQHRSVGLNHNRHRQFKDLYLANKNISTAHCSFTKV